MLDEDKTWGKTLVKGRNGTGLGVKDRLKAGMIRD